LRVNPEKKEEKERVTLALLRATLRLAAAHGFSSLGLREVSRAADIAPTSFYRHFADMEELGLALIDDLAGRYVDTLVERARATSTGPLGVVEMIVGGALAGVASDPELVRFILAERVGAVPAFRAALDRVLSLLGAALRDAFTADLAVHGAKVPAPDIGRAAVVLLLEACSQALDQGPEQVPVLRERAIGQIRMLLSGATAATGTTGKA
jgi:AcrR family transcriptional regulator